MISTFKRNRHFRKVFISKTFTHVQEQKKAMSLRHSTYISSTVKSPLELQNTTSLKPSPFNYLKLFLTRLTRICFLVYLSNSNNNIHLLGHCCHLILIVIVGFHPQMTQCPQNKH